MDEKFRKDMSKEADMTEAEAKDIEAEIEREYDEECKKSSDHSYQYSAEEWAQIVCDYNSDDPRKRELAGSKAYVGISRFIESIAKKLYSTYLAKYYDELIQQGALGFIESLHTYDPSKGKPTTWCYPAIVHYMREYIDTQVHNTTPHYQGHLKTIRDFIQKQEALGLPWTVDDIVIYTGISLTTVLNCLKIDKRNRESMSIEQEIGDGNATLKDFMPSDDRNPEDIVIARERSRQLEKDMLECLTVNERVALVMHYGLDDEVPKSASEIEKLTKGEIKQQDVRSLINMAENKMRRCARYKHTYMDERKERASANREAIVELIRTHDDLMSELESYNFDSTFDLNL